MVVIEVLQCLLLIMLCCLAAKNDLSEGIIPNKLIGWFGLIALIMDAAQFAFFIPDLLGAFAVNLGIITGVSVLLFYTHSIAGGDCKLFVVLAMLFPPEYYINLGGNTWTLFLTIAFAILYGFAYFVLASLWKLIRNRKQTLSNLSPFLCAFLKQFLIVMVYISAINLLVVFLYEQGIEVWDMPVQLGCLAVAWAAAKLSILKNKWLLVAVLMLDILGCILLRMVPISLSPDSYILVVIMLLCQFVVRNNIYQEIPVNNLKKGMILSQYYSMQFQSSRVKGLPTISAEDLRSRLTEQEAQSVQRWAKLREIDMIVIVQKIPFAIFIALGFLTYFVIGSVVP